MMKHSIGFCIICVVLAEGINLLGFDATQDLCGNEIGRSRRPFSRLPISPRFSLHVQHTEIELRAMAALPYRFIRFPVIDGYYM
jgi:hypothetical protein